MAVIEYDSYKQKLLAMDETFENLFKALEIEQARQELNRLELEAHEDGFWNDLERSQKNQMRSKQLQNKIHRYEKLVSTRDDLLALIDMGTEMDDASLLPELEEGYKKLEADVEQARLTTLLSGEYDNCNAILTFHAGAGGTEAQDWAQMLYRMYMQWANKHGFEFEMLDYLDGDEAGLKSATVMVKGENAYGYLKGENGVHRLVRVSPFDANARRQTSFAALEVMPELPDDIEVEIRPEDIEMQVYRASGARRPARQQDELCRSTHPQAHGHRHRLPDPALAVPEPRLRHADAQIQAHGTQNSAARGEDLRHQGRAAQDRMGQPDPILRLHALPACQGHAHRLRDR